MRAGKITVTQKAVSGKVSVAFVAMVAALCVPHLFAAETDGAAEANKPISREQLDFFEKKIRPLLVQNCYKCHSANAEKIRGGMVLDTREGIRRGGDDGPAVVPGDLDNSLLIQAIRYTNKDFSMPPKTAGGKLPDAVIKDFENWVTMGAPDPRDGAAKVVKKYDTEDAKKWWAFQPPKKSAPPSVKDKAWPKSDMDKFLLAALEEKGLKPVADTDKVTLIRRAYFDLIGLPPTPQEVDAFVKDASSEAFAKVVDRLLASPQFGERWGRHWLDVARYAESSGKEVNVAYPNAWRYRDYVIASLNADKPYDQFIREQIAGDLLRAKNDKQRADQLVATGFLALGPKSLNENNPRQFALDVADEQIDAMSQAILATTISCARCHDHKFDPIPQREYYSMAGIFLSTDTRYGTPQGIQNRHASDSIELPKNSGAPMVTKPITAAERAQKQQELDDLKKKRDEMFREAMQERLGQKQGGDAKAGGKTKDDARAQRDRLILLARIGQLEAELKSYDENGQPKALAMGVQDNPIATPQRSGLGGGRGGSEMLARKLQERLSGRPPEFTRITDSPLYARGDVEKPGERVPRGFISILSQGQTTPTIPTNESGRRELAQWLTSRENPLTARVMANRIWHWLFGRGIVATVDNLGNSGQKPDNQALLDSLAVRFMENGWSVKKMVREIVLSRAYQLSSTFDEKDFNADPENVLGWRMNKRRLEAECIHDAMLAVSGQLNLTPPVGSAVALAGDGPIGGPRGRGTSESAVTAETSTRAVYHAVARDLLPDSLAVFDFAEPSLVIGSRETTNVPSQALYLLNSSFVTKQAEAFANRLLTAYPAPPNGTVMANFEQRVNLAYWLVFTRGPTLADRQAAQNFFIRFPSNWKKTDKNVPSTLDAEDIKAAWGSYCRALLASAEFRYLD